MRLNVFSSVGILISLLVLFIGERIVGEGDEQTMLTYLAGVIFIASLGWRLRGWSGASGAAKRVEARLFLGGLGVAIGLGIYGLTTDAGVALMGWEGEAAERGAGALSALWPVVIGVSLAAILFIELAYFRMPVAAAVELRRVTSAAQGGVSLALALVFLFSVNYVASEREVKTDLSYLRTTEVSSGTERMLSGLDQPIQVVLFYPEVNEVYEEIAPYFDAVDAASDQIDVERRDHALSAELARQHRIRGNGFVVLLKGEGEAQQAESFELGMTLESARTRVRRLDGSFQRAFSSLARVERELHLTVGHRERSVAGAEGDPPELRLSDLNRALERSNFQTRELGMAQGLANEVPATMPAVAVIGPRDPFLPEERESLLRYARSGGRLVLMLDPGEDHGLDPLLHALGLELQPGMAASMRQHRRLTGTPSDRGLIFSSTYSAHPIVTNARRQSGRIATIFVRGGALERRAGSDAQVTFPLRTGSGFWLDTDGDWERSDAEAETELNLIAAVTVPNEGGEEGRVVVIADADFVSDMVLRNPGNALVFGDVMQWFLGEEEIIGDTATEEDVRIEHTRDEDKIWFYGTSFGAPLPLLLLGLWMALRRRRRRETHRPETNPEGDAPIVSSNEEVPSPAESKPEPDPDGTREPEVEEGDNEPGAVPDEGEANETDTEAESGGVS